MKKIFPFLLLIAILGAGCSSAQNPPGNQPATTHAQNGTTLDLHGRGLTTIPTDVFSRTELVTLDLSNNGLTGAPQSQIGQLKNLQTLDLSNNSLTGLPAELGQLSKLEVLDVSNNKLTGLPMELGNLTQLRVLNVSGNPYSKQDLDGIATKLANTKIIR